MNEVTAQKIGHMNDSKIFVAGHRGMVGSAIVRRLEHAGYNNLLLKTREEVDLLDQRQVHNLLCCERPRFVYLAAAKVGGIHANSNYPAQFIYNNTMIAANVINAAYEARVSRLLFLGSSCVYPKMAPQPMTEDCLLTGTLEPTNEPYAIAKIAGIKMCESYNREYGTDFRTVMPTNLYGPNDNFDLKTSHVLPALIRKFHEAKTSGAVSVEVWGSGTPRREFLHVDDLADACLHLMTLPRAVYTAKVDPMNSQINVGCGEDVSIAELAEIIGNVIGFEGLIRYNSDFPDGTPHKQMDASRLASLGWKASIDLEEGIRATYEWFLENKSS